MAPQMIRHTMLALALTLIPGFAAAAGSQAGDSGRQPIGADNEGPRVAVPNQALSDDGAWSAYDRSGYRPPYYGSNAYYYVAPGPQVYYYTTPSTTYYGAPSTIYYSAPPYYYSAPPYYAYNGPSYTVRNRDEAWAYCDRFPLAERASCRNALIGPY